MRILFLTVGDPGRLTGGYLYHREVFARLRARSVVIDELSACGASVAEQLAAAPGLGARVDPTLYDALVIDALARIVAAPWADTWRAARPLVAMIHELPSVAAGATTADDLAWEAPLLRADRLIAVSADGARALTARGAPPDRIVVASGGFDRLLPGRENELTDMSHSLIRLFAPPFAVCVAQWITRKGLLELVRAWARAAPPGWRLELVGETEADSKYAALVRQAITATPEGCIVVRGPLGDAELAAAYAQAAFFVLPSRFEGYGLVYAEAMAYGLPIVACNVGPLPELVGQAGLLVPPGDEGALAAALARLAGDPDLRAALSIAARRRAATLPTWDDTTRQFIHALKGTCSHWL